MSISRKCRNHSPHPSSPFPYQKKIPSKSPTTQQPTNAKRVLTLYNTPRKQFLRAKGWIPPRTYTPPSDEQQQRLYQLDHTYHHTYPRTITPPDSMAPDPRFRHDMPNALRTHRIIRVFELLFALIFLVLLCYSFANPGWWLNLGQPLGFGSKSINPPNHVSEQLHTSPTIPPPIIPPHPNNHH